MSKNKGFGFQRSPRLEQPDQGAPDQPAKIAHRCNYRPVRGRESAVLGLRLGTALLNWSVVPVVFVFLLYVDLNRVIRL